MRRPRFIAEQARNARGLLGRIIAFIMARETWGQNLRAMDALDVDQSDQILDLGCGHGRSLTELAARAPTGRVVGVDPSGLMVEIAAQRNRALIEADRVDVVLATVESLPFRDDVFDKVLCVHVLYFWKDLDVSLREIVRTRPMMFAHEHCNDDAGHERQRRDRNDRRCKSELVGDHAG